MRPAIRIPGSCGLIPAQALTTASDIYPHREPSPACLAKQNHRVANGIIERTLTVGLGKAGKCGTTIVENDPPEMLIGLKLRPRESL